MVDLAQLNNFRHALDNVQSLISNMSDELNKVIASVNKNQPQNAIKSLFDSKQIPFPENASKELYETYVRDFAEIKKWRPVTLNKVLNQINDIYETNQLCEADLNKPVQKLSRRARKKLNKTNMAADKTNMAADKTEETLRKKLLKFGINLGSDFSRTTISNLVQQKAKEMNWRNNTLTKNLVIINKILDSIPVVQNKTSNWYSEMEATRISPTENSESDSDSDASFSRYMKDSLERISKYSLRQSNVIENFNDTGED
jgi:hypothetical protein